MRKKLKNRTGASMMLALLFLFFCLTAGAAVLTAASVSAGRTERVHREQQDYLAVASAAGLLQKSLSSMSFTGFYTATYLDTIVTAPRSVEGFERETTTIRTGPFYSYPTPDASWSGWETLLAADIVRYYRSTTPEGHALPPPLPWTHYLKLDTGDADMAVAAALTASDEYSIGVTLWNWEEDQQALRRNEMSFILSGYPTLGFEILSANSTTYSTTVTWTAEPVRKGGIPF